ncbi:MAG: aminotransferase class IV [Solirubrobacterales bacterium]
MWRIFDQAMSQVVILNGRQVDPEAPALGVGDSAVLHGDAYFETFRTYGGRPALLNEHLERLTAALEAGGFTDTPAREQLEEEVAEAIGEFSEGEVRIRVTVSRGETDGFAHNPASSTRIVTATLIDSSPAGLDAKVKTVDAPGYAYPHKSTSYQLQSQLLRRAKSQGFDEALIADSGQLIEGATSNVFMVVGADLVTPALGRCLPGVTRAAVIELAAPHGLTPVERDVSTDELRVADAVFITNSLIEIRRVVEIDGQEIGARAQDELSALHAALLDRYSGVTT